MSWAERSTGISPTITKSTSRPCSAASTASTPISPDIDERIEVRLAPFLWKAIRDARVLIAEDLGAAPAPLVLVQVQCYTGRSAASRHPSRWRGAATDM
jgi:HSP20 family molecular chaperone IbpA